jgi:hypothetical protein
MLIDGCKKLGDGGEMERRWRRDGRRGKGK